MLIRFHSPWFESPIPPGIHVAHSGHKGRRWAFVAVAIRTRQTIWYCSFDRCCPAYTGRHWVADRIRLDAPQAA